MGVVEAKEPQKPLRLWPGVVIVLLQWVVRFGAGILSPDFIAYGVLAGIVGGAALIGWWLFFSRAGWYERLGVLVLMIAAMAATWPFLDVSISTGAMGFLFPMLVMPGLCLAFVLWALASRRMSVGLQRATLVAAIVLPCLGWTLIRTDGFTGSFDNHLAWRWTATPEQRLLAQGDEFFDSAPGKPVDSVRGEMTTPASALVTPVIPEDPAAASAGKPFDFARDEPATVELDWPGFRGHDRDGVVRGVRINTDWSASPPIQLWRRPIGPGWSSVAVHGDFLYTQEQRGDDEVVAAYRVSTGMPVWKHRDAARFWESNGGAGPRATPTFSGGRLYAFGATGILNALDAADGRVVWSRNVGADSHTKVPEWGFASSPLVFRDGVLGDLVIVAAAGKLVAYEAATGVPRWFGPDGGAGYSSPQLLTIDGVPQILLLDARGANSVAPADGARLWELTVTSSAVSAPIIQPALTQDGDVLVGDGQASGTYSIAVSQGAG